MRGLAVLSGVSAFVFGAMVPFVEPLPAAFLVALLSIGAAVVHGMTLEHLYPSPRKEPRA